MDSRSLPSRSEISFMNWMILSAVANSQRATIRSHCGVAESMRILSCHGAPLSACRSISSNAASEIGFGEKAEGRLPALRQSHLPWCFL